MNGGALPELPGGWVWRRLGDIGVINPKLNGENIGDNTEVTFLPMRCVEELTGHFDLSFTKKFSEVKKGYTPFIDGDLLFAKITPCMENGKMAIVHGLKNCIGFGSTEFHVIRLSELFPKKFFFYFLIREELRKDAQRNMTGSAGQLRVPANYIKQIPIPLPPLPEQRRIVTKLEELFTRLDAGVSALQKTQAQLKRYRQSVLKGACEGKLVPTEAELAKAQGREYEAADVLLARILKERREKWNGKGKYKEPPAPDTSEFPELSEGWAWARFDIVCNKIQDGSHFSPKTQYNTRGDGTYLYITAKNIRENGLDLSDVTYVDSSFHQSIFERCNPEKGDVLLTKDGVKTGIAVINNLEEEFSLLSSVALFKPNKSILDSYYLKHFLNSPIGFKMTTGQMTGTAIKRIILEKIRTSYIPLPPLAEQRCIVAEVERRLSIADGVKKTVEQSLAQAKRLRQSILKKAFEGRLVAQDASDEPAGMLLERIKQQKQLSDQTNKTTRRNYTISR